MKSLDLSKVMMQLTNSIRQSQFSSVDTLKTTLQCSEGPTAAPVFDNAMDDNTKNENMKSLDLSKVIIPLKILVNKFNFASARHGLAATPDYNET